MGIEVSILIAISIIFGSIVLFILVRIIKKLFKRKIIEKDTLSFLEQYTHYGEYSDHERMKLQYLDKILDNFRNMTKCDKGISIESRFNDVYYAVFDLDCREHYNLFKKIYSATPYAIFTSSHEHYWAFTDIPYTSANNVFCELNWKVCNDQAYVGFCKNYDTLLIRGLYENNNRKPVLYEINGNLSKNFQLFIDKLYFYYNKEGLELSVMRYKDPTMLIKFNRRRKLQQLKDMENESKT